MAKTRILVVEDERIVAQDIRISLERLGYEVCGAVGSGEEALEAANAEIPDLVLMDIALAGEMNGIETAKCVRERHGIPVVYMTAHTDDKTLADAGATDPLGYIVKPFSDRELKSVLDVAISKARLETERKRAQQAIQESEHFTRAIISSVGEGVIVLDRRLHYRVWNEFMEDLTGIPSNEMIGQSALEHFPIADPASVERLLEQALSGVTVSSPDTEYSIPHTGKSGWAVTLYSPHVNAAGETIGVVATVRDVTERLEAEAKIRESEERFRQLAENITDVFWVITPDWNRVLYISPAYETTWGRSRESLYESPRSWLEAVVDDDREIVLDELRLKSGGDFSSPRFPEYRIQRPDGAVRWIHTRVYPIKGENGAIERVAGICQDITVRKHADEELERSGTELTLRNRISDAFLTVADDEVYGKVLDLIVGAAKSEFGFFGYVDAEGALVCPSMTREVWDRCDVPDKRIVFERDCWGGLWGRALIEKETICINEPLNPPKGHIPMTRSMAVPLIHHDEVVGLICIANRSIDYNAWDKHLVEMAAAHIAPILQARLQSDIQHKARVQAEGALRRLRSRLSSGRRFAGIVGNDPKMLEMFETIKEVAQVSVPVLIQGESGTGKELVANAIHNEGLRTEEPFIPVNCGALPEQLLESELFGHVKGAFTGAIREKKGRFELADKGTIFLDEVGELSPAIQVKLLRALQEGTFERVGGESTIKVDVRVISATNKDLEHEVAAGRFRQDLFYRLCVLPVHVPPLRERSGDVPLLVAHILHQMAEEESVKRLGISKSAIGLLMRQPWPGNVRQLQNVIHFAATKCRGDVIEVENLPPAMLEQESEKPSHLRKRRRKKLNQDDVLHALEETKGNKREAAKRLGVSRATLYRFLNELDKPREDHEA